MPAEHRACPVCGAAHAIGARCPTIDARARVMDVVSPRRSGWDRARRSVSPAHRLFRRHLLKQSDLCVSCGATDRLQLDHIVALADGGDDELWNCQLLCSRCHESKTRKEAKARRERVKAASFDGLGDARPSD